MPDAPQREGSVTADVAVVGGGATGLAAAVAAAELGARVVLLEKRKLLGGNSNMAEGIFATESPLQQRMRIDAPSDLFFKLAMDYAHQRADPLVVRAFIDKSGDTVRWLEGKGLEFDWVHHLIPNQGPRTWHCLRGHGKRLTRVLERECERLGVQVVRGARAEHLMIADDGAVRGVEARIGDARIVVEAGSVIVGTGGFGGDPALLDEHCGAYSSGLQYAGIREVTGDGLRMALEAGAATEGLGRLQTYGPVFADDWEAGAIVGEPTTVWVNDRGERFADESLSFNEFEMGNAVLRQPGARCTCLFDAGVVAEVHERGLLKGVSMLDTPPGCKLPDLDARLARHECDGVVKTASTWADIAGWLGLPAGVLEHTVGEYNAACERRRDPVFAKDPRYLRPLTEPPFVAMRCTAAFLGTLGGIKIDEHMRVLGVGGEPILGLYAGGVDTGGWESDTYCALLPGSTYGFALNSGRIAGEHATRLTRDRARPVPLD